MTSMRTRIRVPVAVGFLALSLGVTSAFAQDYTLQFLPTQNAPPGAWGVLSIKVGTTGTVAHFSARGLYPDTVYTIWTVYNVLDETKWNTVIAEGGHEVPSASANARPGFPKEGNGVSPLARLDAGFTSGMGTDPGASFLTNGNGDGEVQVRLDYNLMNGANNGPPVSSKDIIVQTVPTTCLAGMTPAADGKCYKSIRVTTTWLRRFIAEYPLEQRPTMCANYWPAADPENALYDAAASNGMNAQLWQCVDPATANQGGLPRVHRYEWDHFRLANHPDDLTHGFIGGNGTDHWIDMVGRRADVKASTSTTKSR